MRKIRLAIRGGGHVADVEIPPFRKMPDVVVWGERFFALHGELSADGDACSHEYREVFVYVIPPDER
jgi:hypothetical protein